METSVDADLSRHPLRLNDTPLARGDATPACDDAGPAHWGESEGEESFGFSGCDEDDIPCTQELDPRPLAGMGNGPETTGMYGNGPQTTVTYGGWK